MTLRRKILWACSPLLVALVIVAAIAAAAALRLGQAPATILMNNFRTIDAAHEMRESLDAIDRDLVSELVLDQTPDHGLRRTSVARFEEALDVQVNNVTEPGEPEVTDELVAAWRSYRVALDGSRDTRVTDLPAHRSEIQDRLNEILRMNRTAMRDKSHEAERDAARAAATMLGLSAFAVTLALAITVGWLRRLLLPLRVVDRGVRRIAEGDFEARLKVDASDEVATLARSFNEMADRLAEYKNSSVGELMRARYRLEAVMDSLTDAVVLYGPEQTPLLWNHAARRVLPAGWDARIDTLPEPLREAVVDAISEAVRERRPHLPESVDDAVELPGGDHGRWWLVAAHPVEGVADTLDGVTIALRDVSRARRAADFRGDLVAAAAHELRTPLTSLQMAVHLCLEQVPGPLNDKQSDLLETARSDAARLETLVEEMLDLARLEAGGVRLDTEPVRASALVATACGRFEERVREANVQVQQTIPEPSPTVRVDVERVRSVFDNLLENALRHAPSSSRLELGVEEAGAEVRFWVEDEGPGIPQELREHVFEKFVRVPGTPKRGTGLGLSIARDIVHAHGGRVGVEAGTSGGARIWFTLPKA